MTFKPAILASPAFAGLIGCVGTAAADSDELKCTAAQESSWMSREAAKDLLMKQGFKEVRDIEVTDGKCYEVYAVDSQGAQVELYLDPTSGSFVDKED